jgi:hypothetical protein
MNQADKGKTTCTVGGWVTAPVDSLVKPLSLADVRDWWLKKRSDIPDDDAMAFLFGEIESLQADREWQIKQNVKMFEALEEISKADGTPEAPKHVSRSALILVAINGMVEAV